MNLGLDAHTDAAPWAHPTTGTRRAVTLAVALAIAVGLAGTPPASAQDTSEEVSASTDVQAGGDAELCLKASGNEQCADLGRNAGGQLEATVVVSSEREDPGARVAVEGCPDNQAGAVIVFSGTGPGAQIQASFDGEATVDGESQDIEEDIGPIEVGPSGEASASVCGSASGEVGGGDGDLGKGTLLDPVKELLGGLV